MKNIFFILIVIMFMSIHVDAHCTQKIFVLEIGGHRELPEHPNQDDFGVVVPKDRDENIYLYRFDTKPYNGSNPTINTDNGQWILDKVLYKNTFFWVPAH